MTDSKSIDADSDRSKARVKTKKFEKAVLGVGSLGIAASISVISSTLLYAYGKDEETACGAKILTSHFGFSLAFYAIILYIFWLVARSIELNKRGTSSKRVRLCFMFLITVVLAGFLASDYTFIINLPLLPKPLTPAACQAVVDQARLPRIGR